jgi:hypothetical protein
LRRDKYGVTTRLHPTALGGKLQPLGLDLEAFGGVNER